MQSSEVDIGKVREFLKEKKLRRQVLLDERYEKANNDFERILRFVIERYNPVRIYQWGSLLDRNRFSEISDIDIAVEGIESYEEFSKLYGDIEPMTEFSIDLVRMEKIHPLHAESIRQKGRLVYERSE